MTERFLVTGALGCIGGWAVRNLVLEGTPVVVFDLATEPKRLKLLLEPDELARVKRGVVPCRWRRRRWRYTGGKR
jgi:nucleoside-diphosphate-sugar epimerase